jgi:predicted PhzF superfamily epimerase YddE/YHI9
MVLQFRQVDVFTESCHAWLEAGGRPARPGVITQECGAGLVPVRRIGGRLSFQAPPLVRSGPTMPELVDEIAGVLRTGRDSIIDSQWVDNGPGWVAGH